MATATTRPNPALAPLPFSNRIVPVNSAPADFNAGSDLPEGFLEFLAPLHAALTLRQRALWRGAIMPWRKRMRASFPITCRLPWLPRIPGALSFQPGARISETR
jgi:hypothetical protein